MAITALRTPSELSSPQLGAVSGGQPPQINYEQYIESSAAALPAFEEADYSRRMQEEAMRLEREARAQASRDSNIAMGIQGATTAAKLGTNPILQRYGSKVWNALTPKPPIVSAAPMLTSEATQGAVSTVPSYMTEGIAPTASFTANGVTQTAPVVTDAIAGAAPVQTQGLMSKTFDKIPGGSTLGKLGAAAGTTIGAYGLGSSVAGGSMPGNLRSLIPSMGKNESKILSGAGAGALAGFATGGPVGSLVGAIFGAVGSKNKSPCILATACYGEKSYQVELFREYRDSQLDRETLRGYYALSESVLPLMETNPEVMEFVRNNLVDPLAAYAEWKLGYTKSHPDAATCAIVKNFVSYCKDKGVALKTFERSNGEEI